MMKMILGILKDVYRAAPAPIKSLLPARLTERLRMAARGADSPAALLSEGFSLLEQADFLGAKAAFEAFLDAGGSRAAGHLGLGRALDGLGQRPMAIHHYKEVLKFEPHNAEARFLLTMTRGASRAEATGAEIEEMFPKSSLTLESKKALRDFLDGIPPSEIATLYADNNLITFQSNLHFLKDPHFVRTAREVKGGSSWGGTWRAHVQVWAARQALRVPGDFMELGVHMGVSAALVYRCLDLIKSDRTFYLYDTFAGLAEHDAADRGREHHELLQSMYLKSSSFDDVRRRFKDCPNVEIVKGTVPETLHQKSPQKIAYLHLDLNAAKPEIAALELLWDRLTSGAVVLLDDFGTQYDNQTQAHLWFFRAKGLPILELPTSQGLVIKT